MSELAHQQVFRIDSFLKEPMLGWIGFVEGRSDNPDRLTAMSHCSPHCFDIDAFSETTGNDYARIDESPSEPSCSSGTLR